MNRIDLLILDGPPGTGKSSLAEAIAGELRQQETPHAVIEMDDLARVYPLPLLSIMYKNLACVWPNYEALGELKVIIPTYMQQGERKLVMDAAPAKRTTICEVTVPSTELVKRVTQREADEAIRERLIEYVYGYPDNRTPEEHVDFAVSNFDRPVQQVAQEIIDRLGWLVNSELEK